MFFSLQTDFSRGLCCSTQNQHEAKPRRAHQSIGQFLPGQPASLIIDLLWWDCSNWHGLGRGHRRNARNAFRSLDL